MLKNGESKRLEVRMKHKMAIETIVLSTKKLLSGSRKGFVDDLVLLIGSIGSSEKWKTVRKKAI